MKSKKIGGELAFAGSLLILGLVVLYDTSKMLVPPGSGTVGPQIFPYLVSGFVILISLGLFFQIFRGNLGVPEGTEFGEVVEKTDFNCRYIIIAGAILINSDSDMGSFTQIRRFDIIDLSTKIRTNQIEYFN